MVTPRCALVTVDCESSGGSTDIEFHRSSALTHTHTHTCSHSHSHSLTRSHSVTLTLTLTLALSLFHSFTHTYIHTHTHALSLSHTLTHTHSLSHSHSLTHSLTPSLTQSLTHSSPTHTLPLTLTTITSLHPNAFKSLDSRLSAYRLIDLTHTAWGLLHFVLHGALPDLKIVEVEHEFFSTSMIISGSVRVFWWYFRLFLLQIAFGIMGQLLIPPSL